MKSVQSGIRWLGSRQAAPYLFVLPFIVSFALFFAYPLVQAVLMSFQQVLPDDVRFIGADNWRKLLNEDFYKALYNNTRYAFWTIVVLVPVPLALAVLLNAGIMRARHLFRAALFVPALTSVVVAGIIFRLIFGELDGSLMNSLVNALGLPSRRWLADSATGMFALVVLAAWRWTGINLIYFLSALQTIPRELYEAAEMDGAGAWKRFVRITVPMLKPITVYVLTITVYGGYAMFTESYMLWGSRGSPENIGLTMVGYIYQQGFQYFDLGYGATIGLVLLAITLAVSLVQLRLTGMMGKED